VRELTVIYDSRCGLCTRIKSWLVKQPAYVRVRPMASNSWESRERFPELQPQEIAVIADTGEVWLGNHAWIICLWALEEYRGWAIRLSTPTLLPLARQAFALFSESRFMISRLLRLDDDTNLAQHLANTRVPPCQI
jgi:predicted DCC family thiol-disulfide oxidoreductase YuxK